MNPQFKITFAIFLIILISQHIQADCNNSESFSDDCSDDAKIIKITPDLEKLIVAKHNSLRDLVAQGNLKGFSSAVRMATMIWDSELAKLAERNVKQCRMKHDRCHNTEKFRNAGQNLAQNMWSGQEFTVEEVALQQIDAWFNENTQCSMDVIKMLKDVSTFGHFIALVEEKNFAVGCSILRQTANNRTEQFMACNYAYGNIVNQPVYRDGPTASKCTTGPNPEYKGLCSTDEEYDVIKADL